MTHHRVASRPTPAASSELTVGMFTDAPLFLPIHSRSFPVLGSNYVLWACSRPEPRLLRAPALSSKVSPFSLLKGILEIAPTWSWLLFESHVEFPTDSLLLCSYLGQKTLLFIERGQLRVTSRAAVVPVLALEVSSPSTYSSFEGLAGKI